MSTCPQCFKEAQPTSTATGPSPWKHCGACGLSWADLGEAVHTVLHGSWMDKALQAEKNLATAEAERDLLRRQRDELRDELNRAALDLTEARAACEQWVEHHEAGQRALEEERRESGRLRAEAETLREHLARETHLHSLDHSLADQREQQRDAALAQKDGAYAERNRCVALIARLALLLGWRAGVREHPSEDTTWDADWRTIVFVDLPTGQTSWHFHDSERHLLGGLPRYPEKWDGHSTEEKYRRLAAVVDVQSVAKECMRLAREAERERVLSLAESFGPDLTAARLAAATRAQGDGT